MYLVNCSVYLGVSRIACLIVGIVYSINRSTWWYIVMWECLKCHSLFYFKMLIRMLLCARQLRFQVPYALAVYVCRTELCISVIITRSLFTYKFTNSWTRSVAQTVSITNRITVPSIIYCLSIVRANFWLLIATINYILSVSYTHLDVYKRQVLTTPCDLFS